MDKKALIIVVIIAAVLLIFKDKIFKKTTASAATDSVDDMAGYSDAMTTGTSTGMTEMQKTNPTLSVADQAVKEADTIYAANELNTANINQADLAAIQEIALMAARVTGTPPLDSAGNIDPSQAQSAVVYKGVKISQPLATQYPVTPEVAVAQALSVTTLIDQIQAAKLDDTNLADSYKIGAMDTANRLQIYAAQKIPWEQWHLSIVDMTSTVNGKEIVSQGLLDTAKKWQPEIRTFQSYGGSVSAKTIADVNKVIAVGVGGSLN